MAALIEKEQPKLMWQLKSKEAPAATALGTATTAVLLCQMDIYHQCYFNINKDLTLSSSQISVLFEHSTTVVTFVKSNY